MKTLSIQLKPETVAQIDQSAQRDGRPRSQYIRRILERALTGEERLKALQAIAAAELEAANVERVPAPNASEVIAAASADGSRALLAAHEKIAATSRKVVP
jgi:predicted transcriptional regulator